MITDAQEREAIALQLEALAGAVRTYPVTYFEVRGRADEWQPLTGATGGVVETKISVTYVKPSVTDQRGY